MKRIATLSSMLALSLSMATVGCDSTVNQADSGDASGTCPTVAPWSGGPCGSEGLSCSVSGPCGGFADDFSTFTCTGGTWRESSVSGGCDEFPAHDDGPTCPPSLPEEYASCFNPYGVTCSYEGLLCGGSVAESWQAACVGGQWSISYDPGDCDAGSGGAGGAGAGGSGGAAG